MRRASGREPGDDLSGACGGHEQPRLVADNFGEAALRLVFGQSRGLETGQFETLLAADQSAFEMKRRRADAKYFVAAHDDQCQIRRCKGWIEVEPQARAECGQI